MNFITETEYHRIADQELTTLFDALEEADREGLLEVEYEGEIFTLSSSTGRQWVISKHAPSRQLWLSSPLSGGLHFDYDGKGKWLLAGGRPLREVLAQELKSAADIEVSL